MVTISLLILAVVCFYVGRKTIGGWIKALSEIGLIVFAIVSAIAFILLSLKSYDYNLLFEKRKSIEFTVQSAKESGNHDDPWVVFILKEYNEDLSVRKYNNTLFLFDEFIDDRFDELELLR